MIYIPPFTYAHPSTLYTIPLLCSHIGTKSIVGLAEPHLLRTRPSVEVQAQPDCLSGLRTAPTLVGRGGEARAIVKVGRLENGQKQRERPVA
mmetsp:Transcript_30855/g.80905  ORF Transcript_30855/g.80905 Transcript_30855/m.80905 type:complete len:92 (-) Transcript_30855:1612-1887(-)